MTDGNTYVINRRLDEREDWDALEEVTAELEQAEAKIVELEAKLAKAMEALEKISQHDIQCWAINALAELKGETDE